MSGSDPEEKGPAPVETPSRFAELDELQREVAQRIRDNARFLERFLDEDYPDEDDDAAGEDEPESEEL